ncbi:MAG: uroporphyrinogen decarboxylase family protein, partial [Dehalococcoidia bacterium]
MPDMTKKTRVRAAVAGEPVDRVPVGLWGHDYLRESEPHELVAQTVEAYRENDWDFVKFNPRAGYFAEAWGNLYSTPEAQQSPRMVSAIIESAADLGSVTPVDPYTGVFGDHLYALRMLADEIGSEVDIIHTIFSPLSVAALLCGPRTEFRELAAEDPAAAHGAVQAVEETLTEYAVAALTVGASGIFFAPLGWSSRDT